MKKQSKEILSNKTATALKAELSKYSDIFNVKETQELVQEVVSSVTEKTLTDWINTNMDSVVKKSVKEEAPGKADMVASAIQKAMNKHKGDESKTYQLQQARKAMNKGDLDKAEKIAKRLAEKLKSN